MIKGKDASRISSEMAHAMRTPLAVIQMNSEIALLNSKLPGETKGFLQSTIKEVEKLSKMITSLLENSPEI